MAVLLLAMCTIAFPAKAQEHVLVRVTNPLATTRTDEVVAVPWEGVASAVNGLSSGRVRVLQGGPEGKEVPLQVVSRDDGQSEELLFLASFRPKEQRTFLVEAAAPKETVTSHAHVMHDEKRDDVAWENRRVAFRTYGQGLHALEDLVSSGIDVWLKRVRKLVVDEWYKERHYHTDTGEGADFFKVGSTLGAGGTAVWRHGQLYRAPNFSNYQIIDDGPLRATVELEYGPWDAGGLHVTEHKRITIDAGDYAFRSVSRFYTDGTDSLTIATGLVKRPGVVASTHRVQPWTWLSMWGPVEKGTGGHGDLGTAVLLRGELLRDTRATEKHRIVLDKVADGDPHAHYVATGWTASDAFDDVEDWWNYLNAFSRQLREPLKIDVENQ